MTYKLTAVEPDIFLIEAEPYQLAMMLWRATEFRESPAFAGKVPTLAEYMEWYAATGEGSFTYPKDWVGFNVSLEDLQLVNQQIRDVNHHDDLMQDIQNEIERQTQFFGQPVSIIGIKPGDTETLKHEMAHAYYAVRPTYKDGVHALLASLSARQVNRGCHAIAQMGYNPERTIDEFQAYASTGLVEELKGKISQKVCARFERHFRTWNADR